jgi:Cu-processing system permease protein
MTPAFAVALNTFRENRRDRILYVLVLFAALLILGAVVASDLTPYEQTKILLDLGQAAISLVGGMIAIFLGIGLVSKEIERRTIYVIVSKPVSRNSFLFGKVLGLTLTLSAAVGFMAATLALVSWIYGAPPGLALLQSVILLWIEMVLLTAMAVTFATFTTTSLAAMFSVSCWMIGSVVGQLKLIGDHSTNALTRFLLNGTYWVFPDLSLFDAKTRATYGIAMPPIDLAYSIGYGLLYTTALLLLASLLFSKRDFR